MNADDLIPLPGLDGEYARRAVVDAWDAAGRPPVNSATRLYAEQRELRDGWDARLPGYSPADDPDDETQPLAHVRGVALDLDATDEQVAALEAAGLVRPYDYEPWHWQLPGDVRRFPIITAYPDPITTTLGDIMSLRIIEGPFYRAAGCRVIHNGSAAMSVPAGWVQHMVQSGVSFASYATDNELEAEVNMVWQLGGFSADVAARKTADMLAGVKA